MSSTQIKKKLYIKINTVAVEIVTTVFVEYFGIVDGGKISWIFNANSSKF